MTRNFYLAIAAAAALCACSQPKVAKCSQNSDCPTDAICVSGLCQRGVPSGGTAETVSGSGHLTAGTMTMDAVIGQPVVPAGTDGAGRRLSPANNTR